jgi:hypothetical protein
LSVKAFPNCIIEGQTIKLGGKLGQETAPAAFLSLTPFPLSPA